DVNSLAAQGLLIPGHAYRFYVIVHDGDQNKTGGDVGQACIDYFYPGPVTNPSTVSGTVFNDANNHGIQGSVHAGISNVSVNLLNAANNLLTTVFTDANGNYAFKNLAPNTQYKIQLVQPGLPYADGKDTQGTGLTNVGISNDRFTVMTPSGGNAA